MNVPLPIARWCWLVACWALWPVLRAGDGPEGHWRRWTTEDGLASDRVYHGARDSLGFLWLATDKGLIRFDGTSFHTYHHDPERPGSLRHNAVRYVYVDGLGRLWASLMFGGMARYLPEEDAFRHYGSFGTPEGGRDLPLVSHFVPGAREDEAGAFLVTTIGYETLRYDPGRDTFLLHEPWKAALPEGAYRSWVLHRDRQDRLWVYLRGIGRPSGCVRLDASGRGVERRVALAGFVTQMLEDPDGALWFPTWGVGLYRAGPEDSVARVFRADPSRRGALPADVIQAAIADEAGNRWFGTNGGLAFVPADAEARGSLDTAFARARDRFRNRVLGEAVSGLWLDGSGRLWVATVGGGLYLRDPGALAFERVFESDETAIRQDDSDGGSLLEDGDAGLWYLVGERLARLDLRDDRRDWIDMGPTDPSWAAIPLTTFSRVAGDRIGLGRKFGHLSTVDAHGRQVRHWPVEAPQPAPREALCGFRDREGRFWYTSYQGLYVDTEGLGHAFDTVVAGYDGRQIGQTPDGDLWFGSWNAGVLRIDGSTGERRVYHPDSADGAGLRGADAHFLAVGPNGDVFVRTSRGMNVWRETEGRWTHPPAAGAPPWHQVNDLALAPDGNVWAVDQHRVYRWSPEDNRTLVLDESFGLPDAGYLDVAAPSDGMLYLSTTAGLLRFDPAAIPQPEWPPAVRLTELVLTDARGSRTHSLLGRPAPVLGYREDVIECRFAPLHFGLGGQVTYEYRLSGERGAWIPLEGQPRIVLLDQRPGRYRLEIRGRNAWDQAGPVTTLPLRIRPPWWFTRTAYGGYGLALVLGVVGYNRARLARYRRRQLVLERTVRERTRDIRTERDRSEALLLNILPADIARELKETGQAEARQHEDVSVLFTDFRGFTETAAAMDARELVEEINACFKAFDGIVERFGIEKIKTIGDAYMAAGGLGGPSAEGAHATVCAALAMQAFVRARHAERVSAGRPAFTMRVGIHTGPVVAGIVGVKKFQYDVWGDTVNVASRMESAGAEHRVNCSAHTHALLRDRPDLAFEARGEVPVKGKGTLAMWFVDAVPDGGTEPGRGSRHGGLSTAGPTDGAEARQPDGAA